MIRSKVKLVDVAAGGYVAIEESPLATRQRQLERVDDLPRQIVLHLEDVAHVHLRGLGPEDRPSGCLDELRHETEPLT